MRKSEFLHISDKIDIVDERLDSVEKLLALQEQNLQYHIKRTDLAEQSLGVFKEELVELKTLVSSVKFLGRLLSGLAGVAGFVWVVIQIYQALH